MEPVQVDLQDNGGVQVWASVDDIRGWVDREEEFWGWTFRVVHPIQDFRGMGANYRNRFKKLRSFCDNPAANALELSQQYCESEFTERLNHRWESRTERKLPTSKSAFGKFVASLIQRPLSSEQEPPEGKEATARFALAAAVLNLHVQGSLSIGGDWGRLASTANTLYGVWLAGITTPQIDISHVDALTESLSKSIETATSTAKNQLEKTGLTLATCEDTLARHRESFDKTLEDHRKAIDGIRDAYRKEMALRQPVEYWAERGKEHRQGAQHWLAASALSSVAIVMVLIGMATALWPDTKQVIYEMKAIGGVENVTAAIVGQLVLASAAKFAVVAGIAVWWLRICVRNYLSHVHLARDSSERVAVIKSLIAMSTDEELRHLDGIKDEGLKIALQNVFRHASDGVVKDDAMPATNLFQVFRAE